jgi:hypothetical protein
MEGRFVGCFGAGRLGSGFAGDAYSVLAAVAPGWQIEPQAMALLDHLLDTLVARLRDELGAVDAPSQLDDLFEVVARVLPPKLAQPAVAEVESATAHMGHTPHARTSRPSLISSSSTAARLGSGCDGVMGELRRLLDFLVTDVVCLVHERAIQCMERSATPAGSSSPAGGSPRAARLVIRASAVVEALSGDEAWVECCTRLATTGRGMGEAEAADPIGAWAAGAMSEIPLSCVGAHGAVVMPVPSSLLGSLRLPNHGLGSEGEPQLFEMEGVSTPLPLSAARELLVRLTAWGASCVSLVHFSPDPRGSDQLHPAFLMGEMAGGMLAGVAMMVQLRAD